MAHKTPYAWTGSGPKIYVADFETLTTEPTRVWGYGYANIDDPDNVTIGNNLVEFMQHIVKLGNANVYFHNLRFDATFILYYLLNNGYEWVDDRRLQPRQFTTLYSDTGKMYSMRVRWSAKVTTEFRDSYKKLPMKAERIAKAFNLDIRKGSIDYHKPRPVGYEPTENERKYIHNDVSIIAQAMRQVIAQGMNKLTIGSDSITEYKQMVGSKRFKTLFPVLSNEVDTDIRRAYRGGYTYADDRFSGRLIEKRGVVLDVNSLYPYVMYDKELPYGIPHPFEGSPPESGHYVLRVTFTAKIKPNHIPIIQIKKSHIFNESEYLKVIEEPTTLTVTNIDWKLYNEHYDIDVLSYDGGYVFMTNTGLFDNYIDKWMNVKRNSKDGAREIAKLHLNSLYGKFATSPDVTGKYPVIDDDAVRWIRGPEEKRDPVYTAMGAFITAYARELTIRSAQENYDTFAYADTDSLHLLREDVPDTLRVHSSDLGAWDHEYDFTKAFYMRAKAYMEQKPDGERVVRIAGMSTDVSATLDFDDLWSGNIINGKLVPRNVPGGTVLVPTTYELKF